MRRCRLCGAEAQLINEPLKAYGRRLPGTLYRYRCPVCGSEAAQAFAGINADGTGRTVERAAKRAAYYWDRGMSQADVVRAASIKKKRDPGSADITIHICGQDMARLSAAAQLQASGNVAPDPARAAEKILAQALRQMFASVPSFDDEGRILEGKK